MPTSHTSPDTVRPQVSFPRSPKERFLELNSYRLGVGALYEPSPYGEVRVFVKTYEVQSVIWQSIPKKLL